MVEINNVLANPDPTNQSKIVEIIRNQFDTVITNLISRCELQLRTRIQIRQICGYNQI